MPIDRVRHQEIQVDVAKGDGFVMSTPNLAGQQPLQWEKAPWMLRSFSQQHNTLLTHPKGNIANKVDRLLVEDNIVRPFLYGTAMSISDSIASVMLVHGMGNRHRRFIAFEMLAALLAFVCGFIFQWKLYTSLQTRHQALISSKTAPARKACRQASIDSQHMGRKISNLRLQEPHAHPTPFGPSRLATRASFLSSGSV